MRKHKLLTKQLRKLLPPLYSGDNLAAKDRKIPVKYFNPAGPGTWYALEFDGEDIFFGYVTGLAEDEFGNFSLSELEQFKGPLGIGIERDVWWDPNTTLQDVLDGKKR